MFSKKLRQLITLSSIVLIVFGFSAGLVYYRLKSLVIYTESVNRNADFVQKLEETLSQLKDGELGSRGFIITQDSAFLEPYYSARQNINGALEGLFSAAADRKVQRASLDSVHRLVYERLDILANALHYRTADVVLLERTMQAGKVKMDSTRGVVSRLKAQQLALLKLQKGVQDRLEVASPTYILGIIVAAFFFLFAAMYIIVRQVRELIVYQNKLENKITELADTNRELDLYAFTLTHQMQEPLRKIRLFLSRFEVKNSILFAKNEENQAFSKKMHAIILDGQAKLNQFLDFAHLTQRADFDRQIMDLRNVWDAVFLEKNNLIALKSATIHCAQNWQIINCNAAQIHLLFTNLLDNALKFSDPDRPLSIEIKNELLEDEKCVYISVQDNGIGIEAIYHERIFDIFSRLHDRADYAGLGVGLAVCRRIVALHGGRMAVKSAAGVGSVFEVYLPIES